MNTRDTADERGPTIARLRDLVEDPEGDEPFDGKKGSVRLAVEAWQEDPADGEKKHHAQMLVRQYVSRRRSQGGIGRVRRFSWAMPTDETDLDVLFEKAETRRKAQKKNQGRNREDKSRFFMRVLEDLLR